MNIEELAKQSTGAPVPPKKKGYDDVELSELSDKLDDGLMICFNKIVL